MIWRLPVISLTIVIFLKTLSSFYWVKDLVTYHCDINYITIMTLCWIILLWFNSLYCSIVSLKCFWLSPTLLFLMAMENVICVFYKWMYFIPFLFYTVCIVQPICLRWEFVFTDCKHETSPQSIIRPLVFCSCKPV